MDEIKDKLAKFINAISPSYCDNCNTIFERQKGSKVTCFICTSSLCLSCSSEESFANAKTSMKNIVPICTTCQEEIEDEIQVTNMETATNSEEDSVADKPSENVIAVKPPTPVEAVVTVIQKVTDNTDAITNADEPTAEDEAFTVVKNKRKHKVSNTGSQKQPENAATIETADASEKATKSKVCTFYIQYRCKFGSLGKECTFDHPKLCRSYMKGNTDSCDKGSSCQYLHPNMCNKSLKGQNCNSPKCHRGHFLGLRDLQSKTNQNPKASDESTLKSQQDFHKDSQSANKPNKQSLESKAVTPLQPTPTPPPLQGMELLISSLQSMQQQMHSLQKDREQGREEIRNMWTFMTRSNLPIQTPTLQTSPPLLPTPPPPSPSNPQHTTNSLLMCNPGLLSQHRSTQMPTTQIVDKKCNLCGKQSIICST